MTGLRRLARRYWHHGTHHTARGELSTSQTIARRRQLSLFEEFFPTVILPMPQPVSPAPVNMAALHDWAVA